MYDIVQAFDSLWIQDSFIEMYKSSNDPDDKLSLLCKLNQRNNVAVNTPVGETERVLIEDIVMQGSTAGPLLCSNSCNSLGRKSQKEGKNLDK